MYKNTHRPCYVSKKPITAPFERFEPFHLFRLMGVSVPSLHIESTDSMILKGSKNISIKMLKDVGMTVPKSRETSAVYMQQDRG